MNQQRNISPNPRAKNHHASDQSLSNVKSGSSAPQSANPTRTPALFCFPPKSRCEARLLTSSTSLLSVFTLTTIQAHNRLPGVRLSAITSVLPLHNDCAVIVQPHLRGDTLLIAQRHLCRHPLGSRKRIKYGSWRGRTALQPPTSSSCAEAPQGIPTSQAAVRNDAIPLPTSLWHLGTHSRECKR